MTVRIYPELIQGSDEWHAARCGLMTASEVELIISPKTLKALSNDKEKSHVYELAAQRISRYVEPSYIGDNMLRGWAEEAEARSLYSAKYAPVEELGFITNDRWGFTIGYSPDGRVIGKAAGIECKSRKQKYQVQTIVENVRDDAEQPIPVDYSIQIQTGLLVSEWEWIDFISYSGGLPMAVVRVYPDEAVQDAIIGAAGAAEERIARIIETYHATVAGKGLFPTERKIEQEMFV